MKFDLKFKDSVWVHCERLRCLLEASPLAEWVAGVVEGLGHEAVVIDTRKATGVIRTKKKTDRLDARNLAKPAIDSRSLAESNPSPRRNTISVLRMLAGV